MNSLVISASAKSLQRVMPIATKSLITTPLVSKSALLCMPIVAAKLHPYIKYQNIRPFHYGEFQRSNSLEKERLNDIVNGNFIKITSDLERWTKNGGGSNLLEIYDKYLIKSGLTEGKNTYLGGNCCQMTSHLMARELTKENYNVKLYINKLRDCYHFYLSVTGNGLKEPLIVDPSYRQFFNNNNTKDIKEYNKFLFEKSDPYFVGSRENMKEFVRTLLSKKTKEPIVQEPEPISSDDGTVFWDPRNEPMDVEKETIYWNSRKAVDVTGQLERLRPIMEKYTDINFKKPTKEANF